MIPIRFQPVFFIIAGFIGYISTMSLVGTLIWIAIITISVLVHEFGHALTAKAFGQQAAIELVAMGGLTHHNGKTLKPWQNFLIVLNGPLAGFSLALVAYYASITVPKEGILDEVFYITFWVNVFWTVVNLLPIHPLDGGKLLSITLEKAFGHKGVKASYFISFVVAGGVGILFFVYGLILAGALLFMLAFEGFRSWQTVRGMEASDRDEGLQQMLEEGRKLLNEGNLELAEEKLRALHKVSQEGLIHDASGQFLAIALAEQGSEKEAFSLFQAMRDKLDPELLLYYQRLAANLGHWDEAKLAGERAYSEIPNYHTALINASSYASQGETEASFGWLQRAKQDGAKNIEEYLNRPEFQKIKQQLIERL